jgi:aryl-alcohol dehydrogenase
MQIKAAVVREAGQPFQIEELELDDPGPGEILVEIHAVGLCHTDIAIQNQWFPVPLPLVLGHEGAGVVQAVGEGVTSVAPGDKVALSFASCGACPSCAKDLPAYCFEMVVRNMSGSRPDGTNALHDGVHGHFFSQSSFASHAISTERNTIKLDDDADLSIVGPLGCGIQTGAGTVLNRLRPEAGSSIAIFGVGAVGLAAVMAAKVAGCDPIIAVDIKRGRLDFALELGATHAIDGSQEDVVARIQELTQVGVANAIDTTAVPAVTAQATEALGYRGTLALVGLGPGGTNYEIDMNQLLIPGRNITGVIEGDADPQTFIPHLQQLYAAGRFPYDRLITKYPFEDINQAVQDVESGAATKAVLTLK